MEKRISMIPHKPHATSQPSRFSHTLRSLLVSSEDHVSNVTTCCLTDVCEHVGTPCAVHPPCHKTVP